ncbi:DUF1624 domain-containing protein [Solimicrobium silvestre]|uniref:Putative membrane protein n=1 Tax=Solimicrobium silvestre TaxID=2099400 RepID=A0A2S9GX49_9BURK|nr:heparan-alpha-glucosaminide N-acetyltransferase domain-containing protein [Solimicrobium silvestre]PRC92278.1 putative membrane protein [Solimicrobium silvestre]
MTNGFLIDDAQDQRGYRLTSIDMLRGLVLLIMALDHVRDFVMMNHQDPMLDPHATPLLFFTRWITHFCAPVFVFLAGTSAGLMTSRKNPNSLGIFLLKRGLWLIFVEVFIISTAFTFSPFGLEQMGGRTFVAMQVIWAIGASMVILAGVQFLGARWCLYIGAIIVLSHNFLDGIWPKNSDGISLPLWAALHTQMGVTAGQFQFFFLYPLLPWVGVMLLGFGTAVLFKQAPEKRNPQLLKIGIGLTLGFVLIRAINLFGDAHGWHYQPENLTATIESFFNTTKYPPSLHYLLMTLGPAAIICAYADQIKGWFKDTLVMFGRVPFTFYVAHFYLAHSIAVIIGMVQGFTFIQMKTFFPFNPKQFGLGLSGVYVVWLLVIVCLYPLCRWVAAVKARRNDWWLSYL